jgi:hypothetical protein
MLIMRAFSLVLLLSLTFGYGRDAGCGIDPNGCSGGRQLTANAGGEMDPNGRGGAMDPNGGGAMDPNGSAESDYSACLDPNGGCR